MKVVIADDDIVVRHILSAILEGNAEIVLCPSGQECIDFFKEYSADVVFLDIQLPDFSGPEVLRELRKLNITARVIAVSANPEQEMVEIFGDIPPDAYLEKPFTSETVNAVLVAVTE